MSRVQRLTVVLVLNLVLTAVLVIVGATARSLAVLAEGVDYLADGAAIALSLLAIHLDRRPASARHPQGFPRATRIAALVNGGWLLVLNLLVAFAGAGRLLSHTPKVHALPVIVMSGVAAMVMLLGALLLSGEERGSRDLNTRAVLLDTAADGAAAGGVALAGAVILVSGRWFWLDPAVALAIAAVVGYHSVGLVVEVITALRSSEPEH